MAKRSTGFVFVDKTWYDTSLCILLGKPESKSAAPTHLLVGEMDCSPEGRGVWMKGVKTSVLRHDRVETDLDFLIPWRFVVGLGSTDDPSNLMRFTSGPGVTVLENNSRSVPPGP